MALQTVAGALGNGLARFSQWRQRAAEIKLEKAKLNAATQDASAKDEVATYTFLGVFVFIIALPVVDAMFGLNGEGLTTAVLDNAHRALEGELGVLIQGVVWTAVGGNTAGALIKRYLKASK